MQSADLGEIDAVYDRGSLVALPSDMRIEYVSSLYAMLSTNVQILLITFDYPQNEMPWPPFSVQCEEVESLYAHWCDIDVLNSENVLANEAHFKDRGLTRMEEQTYRLLVR